ncbi:peroxisomal membrane anchor protein conserved region-domain-containing protein [Whalleya microplaca]|nr:peroxisomal membrane anchor protein conserved region-domain-containing protein [Whalleya microplaca]
MAIREDIVASAVSFLQDPNVVSSPVENKLSFLRSKNLTQEEIDAAFSRTGTSPGPVATSAPPSQTASGPIQQQPYQGQYQSQPYGWQAPPPEPPKRDWRDWFIMATVMGGVGYGLYFMTKRYLYPLVSPPTPEKLDQDKSLVDEQFDKAFATIEQLVKDTEALKSSEKERTEKLDKVLEELETFMKDTKSVGKRQEDETDRLREEMRSLKGVIPKSMTANKEFTDNRLKEISNEVRSLKSLVGQRMNPSSSQSTSSSANGFLRSATNNAAPGTPGPASPAIDTAVKENAEAAQDDISPKTTRQDSYIPSIGGRPSPFGVGAPSGRASIPAWQMAASKSSDAQEAGSSS